MGWLDRLLRPFRSAPAEAPAEPVPEPAPAAEPSAARWAARVRPEVHRAPAEGSAPPPAEARAPKPPRDRKRKKARKHAPPKAEAPAAEVMTVEEAERRFRAELDAAAGSRVEPAVPASAAGSPADPADPAPPVTPLPPRPPRERRRAPADRFERLLSRADALLAVPTATFEHLRAARAELRSGWDALGDPADADAPRLAGALEQRLSAFEARLRSAVEARQAAWAANLAERRAIVQEAAALADAGDLSGAGPAMGRLRARLRSAGPVDPADAARLDADLAAAEGRLAARRSGERAGREAERTAALGQLDRLVAQAEAAGKARDPEAGAERVKALQVEWKAVRVPGPRPEVDERWARFRAACDAVFARRAEARAAERGTAAARLEQIVAQVEALAAAEEVVADPDEVIRRAVADWKRAGRAERAVQDALWERLQQGFRALREPVAGLSPGGDDALRFRPFGGLGGS